MINVAASAAPNAYEFLPQEQVPVLDQLLRAVPAAKQQFEQGKVPEALRLLEAAEEVQLNPKVGIPKSSFLMLVTLRMPNMYSA
jgi:hypothetical protein